MPGRSGRWLDSTWCGWTTPSSPNTIPFALIMIAYCPDSQTLFLQPASGIRIVLPHQSIITTLLSSGSTSCYTPCKFTTTTGNQYDISPAGDTLVLNDRVSYPDQFGNTYHYRYLLKLCSEDGNVPLVTVREDFLFFVALFFLHLK